MKPEEKLILLAELTQDDCKCQLNHKYDPDGVPQAINFLCVPIGYNESEYVSKSVRDLTIPICPGCIEALNGNRWVLIYCLECAESQWVLKEYSRLSYHNNNTGADHKIIWIGACPFCANGEKPKGVYFS